MRLALNAQFAAGYKSEPQKVRVLTERWVGESVFCPNCGHFDMDRYENNRPVADFYCRNCREDYELKSKKDTIGSKVVNGAYRTMLDRLGSSNTPNFFLLNYDLSNLEVTNFLVIPKHFFVPEIIEKRKALAPTARRAGWIGCNILLNHIPRTGKIFFVRDRRVEPKEKVLAGWEKTLFLRDEKEMPAKRWLLDVMRSVDKLGKRDFTLDDVYRSEGELGGLHPENRHIKEKIRQQLQVLRDKGYLDFVSRGRYRLV
jgi:type II restriction enzyme